MFLVYCKAVPDTITSTINEFEICMVTILHRSLNYYKGHHTAMVSLLFDVPPSAAINKASLRSLLDYYPRKIESITPRRIYYQHCYCRSSNIIISWELSS